MAETEAGRLLTEAHRQRQLTIRAAALRDLVRIWPAFNLEDIDRSWGPIETATLAVIAQRRRASAGAAANYFRAFRTAEGIPGPAEPRIAPSPRQSLLVASLRLLGPIATKKSIAAGVPNPVDRALTRISGSVARVVLNGGRETLLESARADRQAKGFVRVTDGDPCAFCADLAGFGITGLNAGFAAHDHCGCSQEIAY